MTRLALAAVVFPLLFAPAPAADPDPRSWKDVFGQLLPHGEPVGQAFIGLSAGRTNLAFGQPMRADLFAIAATYDGPYVHPQLVYQPNTVLELTDAAGKSVPFRMDAVGNSGGGGGEHCPFTLWPTKDHAVGIYWKPGTYKLRATVTNPDEPTNPITIPGTFRSNELTLTIREFGAALDTWDGKGELRKSGSRAEADDVLLYVAGLDEASSERLREQTQREKTPWRVAAARFAPVTAPQDRKLTDDEAKQLIADLKHKEPDARIRAARSVPPTAPAEVIAAAVELLKDDYWEWAGVVDPGKFPWVSYTAADALGRLGPVVVEPLIAFADKPGHETLRPWVVGILGKVGPHASAEKYFLTAIRSGSDKLASPAQAAAAEWGKGGLTISRAILAEPKFLDLIRRDAATAIGKHGDLKTDGPTLRKLIAAPDAADISDLRREAVAALATLRDAESLPEFERIARNDKIDMNVRVPAMDGVLALADAKTADRLLLDLINRPGDKLRGFALVRAGKRKLTDVRPLALDALGDRDWYTRVMADYALRGLAGDRVGVGYDPQKPDPKLWRDYWEKRLKK